MCLVFVNAHQKLLTDSLGTLSSAASWISILIPEGHVYSGHLMILKETFIFSAWYICCIQEGDVPEGVEKVAVCL